MAGPYPVRTAQRNLHHQLLRSGVLIFLNPNDGARAALCWRAAHLASISDSRTTRPDWRNLSVRSASSTLFAASTIRSPLPLFWGLRLSVISPARLDLRVVAGLSAAFCLALTFASRPAAVQQWTPQQRAACEPDAMRLCNQYIPDVQRVSACIRDTPALA